MAQVAQKEKRYRWIGIAVASVALLGWVLALYFWSVSAEARHDLEQQVALQGTEQDLDTRITALRAEADQATTNRDQITGELDTLTQQRDEVQTDVATLDEAAQTLRDERETLEAELVQGREELAGIEAGLTQAQDAVTTATQEVSDIGERLQEARQQEADLQASLASLTTEVSQLTADAAEAEQRVQTARDAEASLEQNLLAAQQEQEEITATRDALQQSVDTLAQRREELAADTLAAEQQMQGMQDMTRELSQMLAERSTQLAVLEDRIAEFQQDANARARSDAAGIVPDVRYMHRFTSLTFAADGMFEMTNTLNNDSISGAYELSDNAVTLSNVEGDLGDAEFPMTCAVAPEDNGFSLEDSDGSCGAFAGTTFTPAGG